MKHKNFVIIIALLTTISASTKCSQSWTSMIPNPFSYFSNSSILEKMSSWSPQLIIASVATGITILVTIYGATRTNNWITSIINPEAYAIQQEEEIQKELTANNYNPKTIEKLLQSFPEKISILKKLLETYYIAEFQKEFDTREHKSVSLSGFILLKRQRLNKLHYEGIEIATRNFIQDCQLNALKILQAEQHLIKTKPLS